jgi:hypothetical protein
MAFVEQAYYPTLRPILKVKYKKTFIDIPSTSNLYNIMLFRGLQCEVWYLPSAVNFYLYIWYSNFGSLYNFRISHQ